MGRIIIPYNPGGPWAPAHLAALGRSLESHGVEQGGPGVCTFTPPTPQCSVSTQVVGSLDVQGGRLSLDHTARETRVELESALGSPSDPANGGGTEAPGESG